MGIYRSITSNEALIHREPTDLQMGFECWVGIDNLHFEFIAGARTRTLNYNPIRTDQGTGRSKQEYGILLHRDQ